MYAGEVFNPKIGYSIVSYCLPVAGLYNCKNSFLFRDVYPLLFLIFVRFFLDLTLPYCTPKVFGFLHFWFFSDLDWLFFLSTFTREILSVFLKVLFCLYSLHLLSNLRIFFSFCLHSLFNYFFYFTKALFLRMLYLLSMFLTFLSFTRWPFSNSAMMDNSFLFVSTSSCNFSFQAGCFFFC